MAQCNICNGVVGCSCQLRTSRDGLKRGCTACVLQYDQNQEQQTVQLQQQAAHIIQNINSTLLSGPR